MFEKESVELAEELIGYKLSHNQCSGIIVETEAYPGAKDPACHYNGKSTKRGRVFEKGPGTLYVYNIHGHDCMNFICGSKEYPEGVLLRAIRPVEGLEKMKDRRGREDSLADGPAKLAQAMNIRKEMMNGKNLSQTDLELEEGVDTDVAADSRIGISSAEEWPLRFVAKSSDHLSKTPVEPVRPEKARHYSSENL